MLNIINLSFLSLIKIIAIILLFVLNIVLLLYFDHKNSVPMNYKSSGIGTKDILKIYGAIGTTVGLFSTYLAVKQEIFTQKIIKELKDKNTVLQITLSDTTTELEETKTLSLEQRTEFINLAKQNKRTLSRYIVFIEEKTDLKSEIAKLEESKGGNIFFKDQAKLDQLRKQELLLNQKELEIKAELEESQKEVDEKINSIEVSKNSILNIDFNIKEYFDSLSVYEKISICFLVLNQIIISCVISILFIIYGDYLITRFKLETRFPKLAKIIKYRRQFQKYYLYYNIFFIVVLFLIENLFFIAILFF